MVTYELQQKDFDELVSQYPVDFETVCQLRDNILNTEQPESFEGPELVDTRLHFVPINQFVIRKASRGVPQKRCSKNRIKGKVFGKFEILAD